MPADDVRRSFEQYTQRLLDAVAARADVLGLVLLGSTADPRRVDEWSDHDFFVLTVEGSQEGMRRDLSWLPDAEQVAFAVQETDHGLKVVLADGRVLELAVASLDELSTFSANRYAVVLDRADVAERMRAVAARSRPVPDDLRDLRLFLSLLLIGVGRDRRGEHLVAGQFVRGFATAHLLTVLRHRLPAAGEDDEDDLDVWRRFERGHPEVGRQLAAAHAAPVEECARSMLDLADSQLRPGWPQYPAADVAVVRRRLGWQDSQASGVTGREASGHTRG